MKPHHRHLVSGKSRAGFTLVEVLITGVLALILILPLSRMGYQVVRSSQLARESAEALAAGQAQLENLADTDYEDIQSGSRTTGEYTIAWTVAEVSGTKRVQVTVTWTLTGQTQTLTLNSVFNE